MVNLNKHSVSPPAIAVKLLHWCLPKQSCEYMLGDLEEEFYLRSKRNINGAKYWFWQQAITTSGVYLKQNIASMVLLKAATVILSLLLFIVVFQLIVWLHNADSLDGFSPFFFDTLISGKIHMAIFESAFWQQLPQTWSKIGGWSFLFDKLSLVFSFFSCCLFVYLERCKINSAHQLALLGCIVVFIPYIIGIGYINFYAFQAKMVGPVLSFTLLNAFYLILPVAYMLLRKIQRG